MTTAKEKKQTKTLEAGSYDITQVKTVPIIRRTVIPYEDIISSIKQGKAYVLKPELKKGQVLSASKRLAEKFNVKTKVEKVAGTEQFVMLPETSTQESSK